MKVLDYKILGGFTCSEFNRIIRDNHMSLRDRFYFSMEWSKKKKQYYEKNK